MLLSTLVLSLLLHATTVVPSPTNQVTLQPDASAVSNNRTVPAHLFDSLEELARLVDISYCVTTGGIGITSPFRCLSRCAEFEGFELVTTWNTGPLMSDSSGYIALSHPHSLHGKNGRIIVAFRGTYSIANTIADLSTVPQEYVPYPGDDGDEGDAPKEAGTSSAVGGYLKNLLSRRWSTRSSVQKPPKCEQCEVHMGFYRAWRNTRDEIMPYMDSTIAAYPKYELTVVGHSLGGAVAALAALDFETHGWHPTITTFGEPRIGNAALAAYVDDRFGLNEVSRKSRFRRVTHSADPVPMLPLDEWGYKPHSGEIFVSAVTLPPAISDMRLCSGSEDPDCLAGHEGQIPTRYKLWELFFAHRDYFHRIGLCVPGGDPSSGLRPPTVA